MVRMCPMRSSAKNMCSVRHRPMPSAPNMPRLLGVARYVGVGANLEAADCGSTQLMNLTRSGSSGCAGRCLELARDDAAGGAVERDPVALAEDVALDAEFFLCFVDGAIAGAGHAALAHAAGDDGSVRGHAAARGEDAGGDFHAGDIFWRGFAAYQNRWSGMRRWRGT